MPSSRHLLAFAALLAGDPALAAVPSGSLAKRAWILSEIDGRAVGTRPDEATHVIFGADHRVGGGTGCNSFAGDAIRWSSDRTGTRGRFRFNPTVGMPWTLVQCRPSPAERDGASFWQRMRRPASWRASATQLTSTFADGRIARLTPAPRP
ncbi:MULTISPECIES: META domain-containing protein [unclassified Sphingomonas]|jgi:heat shock protein HslJ|uniref:META domain-containing protein n=1 Tax=unclassified Sphingomonas TaxID=196159 RepID=UPI000E1072C2|nr:MULTISPECIES: META domain-containing protein [unclassified Sphingomonas]AXJ94811.1 hypothetical protein DM480_04140 [Sphingomonas sp. FARSPH]